MRLSLKSAMVLTVFNNFHQKIIVFDQNNAGDLIAFFNFFLSCTIWTKLFVWCFGRIFEGQVFDEL